MDIEEARKVGSPNEPPKTFTRLEIEALDKNLFMARKENLWVPPSGVVYGGQVIGQALASAIRTVPSSKSLHSMHCYFLVGGSNQNNIVYVVFPVRDGKSFSTRVVFAQQNGKVLFTLLASFQRPEFSSLSHQVPMPTVPPPEACLDMAQVRQFMLDHDTRVPEAMRPYLKGTINYYETNPIDTRWVRSDDFLRSFGPFDRQKYIDEGVLPKGFPEYLSEENSSQTFWIKTKDVLADDMDLHRAVLAYASDSSFISAALGGKASLMETGLMASRDHSMWYHSEFRMDEWMLYHVETPRAESGRGLSIGKLFRRDGVLAVTCAQEGVIRMRKDIKKFKAQREEMKRAKL